jgi:hypothetical protein
VGARKSACAIHASPIPTTARPRSTAQAYHPDTPATTQGPLDRNFHLVNLRTRAPIDRLPACKIPREPSVLDKHRARTTLPTTTGESATTADSRVASAGCRRFLPTTRKHCTSARLSTAHQSPVSLPPTMAPSPSISALARSLSSTCSRGRPSQRCLRPPCQHNNRRAPDAKLPRKMNVPSAAASCRPRAAGVMRPIAHSTLKNASLSTPHRQHPYP